MATQIEINDYQRRIMSAIGSTEPSTFGELCGGLKRAGMYPDSKAEWKLVFETIEQLEAAGLLEAERYGPEDRLQQVQLTEAGAAIVRSALDRKRDLLAALEEYEDETED